MSNWRSGVSGVGLLALAVVTAPLWAFPPPSAPAEARAQEAEALAARIDQLIAARWAAQGVKPVARSTDAEFLRRVYLDLTGKIPRVWEARGFLDDRRPDKRRRLVDELLESPLYAAHFATVWRTWMIPDVNNSQVRFLVPSFDAWLRQHLQKNTPYDQIVRELLTKPLSSDPEARLLPAQDEPNPVAFYQAAELKPENLGASTSRVFLGVKLECAQCHNHPFAPWARKQFWEFAAFFSGIETPAGGGVFNRVDEVEDRRVLTIPGTDKGVEARLLDGTTPRWQPQVSTRRTLAEWITSPGNPYFARAAANRLWAYSFGIGLIEPVDELGDQNPPSHPELLDELTRQLVEHGFDLKFLVRALVTSRTYQLSSAATPPSPEEARLFSRMAVRGMSPEQLFDSLAQATGYPTRELNRGRGVNARSEFLARFASHEKRTEAHTSILQALMLMNGRFIADATSVDLERSENLAAILEFSRFKTPAQRIEALYLATLSRKPRPEEMARLVKYVDSGSGKGDARAALADVFWSLLNSSEFMLNH
jgi:uncharacterized protein DUF1549/uncharacterized protein DUF1553